MNIVHAHVYMETMETFWNPVLLISQFHKHEYQIIYVYIRDERRLASLQWTPFISYFRIILKMTNYNKKEYLGKKVILNILEIFLKKKNKQKNIIIKITNNAKHCGVKLIFRDD